VTARTPFDFPERLLDFSHPAHPIAPGPAHGGARDPLAERHERCDLDLSSWRFAGRRHVAATWPLTTTVQQGMPLRCGKTRALLSLGRVAARSR